jgi:N-acetylmuramoyl-L-alanine amidase
MRNLAGANMPAVLIEMGYLSNPDEEKMLTSNAFEAGFAGAVTEAVTTFRDFLEQSPQMPAPPTP